MLDDGAWALPRLFNNRVELQKPPLYYWLVALCAQALGGTVDGWAVRLPAAVSALLCVLSIFYFSCRLGRPRLGFLAALILATCVHFTWLARVGRIDMPLTLTLTIAVGGFFLGVAQHRAWFLPAYVSLALGVLLKGPVAVVLIAAIMTPWAILERGAAYRPLRKLAWSLTWGVPLAALIAAPWFLWANAETGNRLWEVFFVHHNFERGLGGSEALQAQPFWYYLPRLFVDLFPWTLAVPLALWLCIKQGAVRSDPAVRLGLCWCLGVLAFLSCMSFKRADYLLPAYPGVALFLGAVLDKGLARRETFSPATRALLARAPCWLAGIVACSIACWLVYAVWIVPAQEDGRPYQRMAHDIRAHNKRVVLFFRTESHLLAFHLGRPQDTILEWENLEKWAACDFPVYIVMPPDCARDWQQYLRMGRLEHVLATADYFSVEPERPLIVMRTCPPNPPLVACFPGP